MPIREGKAKENSFKPYPNQLKKTCNSIEAISSP